MASQYSNLTVTELQALSDRFQNRIGELEKSLGDTKNEFNTVRQELARKTRPAPKPMITDHALLRYIERAIGLDVEELRSRLLTDKLSSAITSGASGVTIDDVKFVIQGNKVVTVLEANMKPKRKTQKAWMRDADENDLNEAVA